jgi:hypothetical protein
MHLGHEAFSTLAILSNQLYQQHKYVEHTSIESFYINLLIFKIQMEDVGHTYITLKTACSRTGIEAKYCETGMSGRSPGCK